MVAKNSSHPEAYISMAQQEPRRQEGEAPSASLLLWHPEVAPPSGPIWMASWGPGWLYLMLSSSFPDVTWTRKPSD